MYKRLIRKILLKILQKQFDVIKNENYLNNAVNREEYIKITNLIDVMLKENIIDTASIILLKKMIQDHMQNARKREIK